MHKFDGSMETSKQNIDDAWEDVTGNLSACCEEIGLSILNAFDQSEIVQKLIEFTQDLLDMIRSDGVSIFSDFGDIASYALSLVGDGMQIIINVIKVVIMMAHEMYAAFRSLGVRMHYLRSCSRWGKSSVSYLRSSDLLANRFLLVSMRAGTMNSLVHRILVRRRIISARHSVHPVAAVRVGLAPAVEVVPAAARPFPEKKGKKNGRLTR